MRPAPRPVVLGRTLTPEDRLRRRSQPRYAFEHNRRSHRLTSRELSQLGEIRAVLFLVGFFDFGRARVVDEFSVAVLQEDLGENPPMTVPGILLPADEPDFAMSDAIAEFGQYLPGPGLSRYSR